jgi:type I restriction enzyme M protein
MQGIEPLLEISSKATADIGRGLSAFNLKLTMKDGYQTSVENAYQASKVFRAGGPFCDLRFAKPREAKRDPRLNLSGDLIAFQYGDVTWPTHPTTAFYDWLYITALLENRELAFPLLHYRGFTDIEFNPIRSFSCQARSAALYVALFRREALEAAMPSRDAFIATIQASVSTGKPSQPPLL